MRILMLVLGLMLSAFGDAVGQWPRAHHYYELVDSAEQLMVSNDFVSALSKYEAAFSEGYSLGTDISHALTAAVLSKNDSLVKKYAYKLAGKGVGRHFLETISLLGGLHGSKYWKDLLRYAEFTKSRIARSNAFLKKRVDELVYSAQSLEMLWTNSISKRERNESDLEKTMNREFRLLADDLIDLIEVYGFPSEERIGVTIIGDTVLACEPAFSNIIRHSYSNPNGIGGASFTRYLENALDSGLIKPYFFARMSDFQKYENKRKFGTDILSSFRGSFYVLSNNVDFNQIDKNRKEIGLVSLSGFVKLYLSYSSQSSISFEFCASIPEQDRFLKSEEDIFQFLKFHKIYDVSGSSQSRH